MGIYYQSTTDEEDARYIIEGIKKETIYKDEDCYKLMVFECYEENGFTLCEEGANSRQILWRQDEDGKVVIDGVKGRLTDDGCRYIMNCLFQEGKFSTTYE